MTDEQLTARDLRWLAPVLLAGVAVAVVYLATNRYPAFGAGLYFAVVKELLACFPCLPATIPHYTAAGVPFAYPPAAYVLLTPLVAAGADPILVSRLVPPLWTVLYLVPAYLFARDLRDSRAVGAVAALLIAVNPQILQWHVSAGGVVRGFAMLVVLTGLYTGLRLFRTGDRRWLAASTALFGLAVLTHPTYSLFFVTGYALLWATVDRSPRGFGRGLTVGIGGVLLASPWWLSVVATHGPTVFTAAAGTHGGIGGGIARLLDASGWSLLVLAGGALLLAAGHVLLPAWLLASELLFIQPRFAYLVGSVVLAVLTVEHALPRIASSDRVAAAVGRVAATVTGAANRGSDGGNASSSGEGAASDGRGVVTTLALGFLLVGALVGPAVFAAHVTVGSDSTTPQFVDGSDREAMAWARAETAPDATVVVLSDAAEWFPLYADRTMLVGPWGVEWRSQDAYDRQLDTFVEISACETVECVDSELAAAGVAPDYVYVPTDEYTIRGRRHAPTGLAAAMDGSARYERVFENDGVAVFRRTSG
jgi:hypothetical protein